MLEYKGNEDIKKFVEGNIGIKHYSFHQVQIFIKIFISQYNKFETKLTFLNYKKDVTKECINDFAKYTKYFTQKGFAKLLTQKKVREKNMDFIDLLSKEYENDLKGTKFNIPLIFVIKEEKRYIPLKLPDKYSREYKDCEDYLSAIKRALNLPNEIKEN